MSKRFSINVIRPTAVLYLLAVMFSIQIGCHTHPTVIRWEAEDYNDMVLPGSTTLRIEEKSNASAGKAVHLGPDSDDINAGIGDTLIYNISVPTDFPMAVLETFYADDVGGNIITYHLDGANKGRIRTDDKGGWNDFGLDSQVILLGHLTKGSHRLTLTMTRGGSWGVLLDKFHILAIDANKTMERAYAGLKSMIQPNTGLILSATYDVAFTTLYKNSLMAMAAIHEGDIALAERIFDFFQSRFNPVNFNGINQYWNPNTGEELAYNRWEGDVAFFLLALNYYKDVRGSYNRYQSMVDTLVQWLSSFADRDTIAEAYADIYASLQPFKDTVVGMDNTLQRLRERFYATCDFEHVLDHISRAALVFNDLDGFAHTENFKRTVTWDYNGATISALSGFSSEGFINVEISAQIILAWKLNSSRLTFAGASLETELGRMWLMMAYKEDAVNNGLPYFNVDTHWEGCTDEPIVDPALYMLFAYWKFNPMAPLISKDEGMAIQSLYLCDD